MSTKNDKKRPAPISYRPPAELREEFHARVQKSGKSVSGFITAAVFGEEAPRAARQAGIEQQTLAKILAQAARISDDLHEISLSGGDTAQSMLLIEQACDELAQIRAALLIVMGRQP